MELKNICVIGAGVMGRQIALNAAVAGYRVSLTDAFVEIFDEANAWAEGFLDKSVQEGEMDLDDAGTALGRLTCEPDMDAAIGMADLIIECIAEKEEAKYELFERINKVAPAHAVVAGTSSYIPSSRFAKAFDDPSRLLNIHYFDPAMHMKLVEAVRGEHTSGRTLATVKGFIRSVGKICIVVDKEADGFVANRLMRAIQDEAPYLLVSGLHTS